MCVALPGQIRAIVDPMRRIARALVRGREQQVVLGVDDVAPGDWVLVEIGVAVEKLTAEEAADIARQMRDFEDALSAAVGTADPEVEG